MVDKKSKYEAVEAKVTNLGPAQRAGRDAVRARAMTSDLLPKEELDARQEHVGKKRRTGGPPLEEESTEKAKASTPDVPQTECQDSDS